MKWEEKLERYRRLGVSELVWFDQDSPERPLRIWDFVGDDLLERRLLEPGAQSRHLGGYWLPVEQAKGDLALRLSRDPHGQQLFPTLAEYNEQRGVWKQKPAAWKQKPAAWKQKPAARPKRPFGWKSRFVELRNSASPSSKRSCAEGPKAKARDSAARVAQYAARRAELRPGSARRALSARALAALSPAAQARVRRVRQASRATRGRLSFLASAWSR